MALRTTFTRHGGLQGTLSGQARTVIVRKGRDPVSVHLALLRKNPYSQGKNRLSDVMNRV